MYSLSFPNLQFVYVTILTLGSSNEIEYVTPASAGNPIDFGDRTATGYGGQATSSSTRGVFWGNREPNTNIIDYVEIPTLGNALDFGDTTNIYAFGGATASPTRYLRMGGKETGGGYTDTMDYVHIMTTGNAVDFGNLTNAMDSMAACSNGHGGLG